MEKSLSNTTVSWNGMPDQEETYELFRNNLVSSTRLMTREQFESVLFEFKSTNTDDNEEIKLTFEKQDFQKVEGADATALFKSAAYKKI